MKLFCYIRTASVSEEGLLNDTSHRLWYLKDIVDRVIYMESGKIANEWDGDEFASFNKDKINDLKLRPLDVSDILSASCGEACGLKDECDKMTVLPDEEDGIVLRDFFFAYHRNPYLFWKKMIRSDADRSLKILEYMSLKTNTLWLYQADRNKE